MPITPHFALSQDESNVFVQIRVPHVRVSVNSVEVVVDGPVLHFSSPPYLLVLTFPLSFQQDEESECAQYDPSREGGMVMLRLRKQEPDIWPDLDLTGALVSPKAAAAAGRVGGAGISIVSSQENECGDSSSEEEEMAETESADGSAAPLSDWKSAIRPHYGFLNQHAGMFTDLAREGIATEMLQLPNPDETDAHDRREMRRRSEQEAFDPDRYLGDLDLQDDYIYQSAMAMESHWNEETAPSNIDSLTASLATLTTDESPAIAVSTVYFTQEESAQLAAIPYPLLPDIISSEQHESLSMGLLDILFACVYDYLLTDGDPTVESSWTVSILSCTLSWLEEYKSSDTLDMVVQFSTRRALIYPYLRNLDLTRYCWDQVQTILRKGRRCVIRCFLRVRSILDKSEFQYLGNRLYIDHYLAWLQRRVKADQILSLARSLSHLLEKGIEKDSLGLDLEAIEERLQVGSSCSAESGDSGSEDESDDETNSSDNSSACSTDEESGIELNRPELASKLHSDELSDSKLGKAENVGLIDGSPPRRVLIEEIE